MRVLCVTAWLGAVWHWLYGAGSCYAVLYGAPWGTVWRLCGYCVVVCGRCVGVPCGLWGVCTVPSVLRSAGVTRRGAVRRAARDIGFPEDWDAAAVPPPPLAQARPRSQKSGQNGGSTPAQCLDKAVHAHDTGDSQTGNNIVSRG